MVAPEVTRLPPDAQADFAKKLASLLEKEGAAFDVGGYRDAPPGLRIWCGATVDAADVDALTPLARLGLRRNRRDAGRLTPPSPSRGEGRGGGVGSRPAA